MTDKTTILVIDDEVQIRRLLKLSLEKGGYGVVQAESGEEGTLQVRTGRPDLAILDLGLPDMDGLAVLREIRRLTPLPVIILSVRSSEEEIIAALDAGADDYLTKPFRTGELLARVRACLRKVAGDASPHLFSFGQLQIDLDARTVTKGSTLVKLTAIEFALLSLFARNAGRVLTHRYILEQVWGPAYVDETQYTRVHVGNLRKKIEEEPEHPHYIQTESGIGYRFVKS
jgi:two-component system KDP operon response regulator KdpE